MQDLTPEDPAAIGPYRLTARLGEGGMGQVFLGESVSGRRVAVKVVRPHLATDPGFRHRFRREIEAARTVGGFWTAPVVDADPEAPMPWVASAYIEAPDLGQLVVDGGPLPEGELRRLAAGLAEALEAVHRAGLVHRDLKPSNVLVTGDGPRVIDFGISKALEGATALTGTGLVVGTPGFMSPEQATGAKVGAASDLFSLGAVLAFAATGAGPFGAGSVPALLYRVVHDAPRLDGVPEALRGMVTLCLAKEPERRPTAAELLELLSAGGAMARPAGGARRAGPRAEDGGGVPEVADRVPEDAAPPVRPSSGTPDPRAVHLPAARNVPKPASAPASGRAAAPPASGPAVPETRATPPARAVAESRPPAAPAAGRAGARGPSATPAADRPPAAGPAAAVAVHCGKPVRSPGNRALLYGAPAVFVAGLLLGLFQGSFLLVVTGFLVALAMAGFGSRLGADETVVRVDAGGLSVARGAYRWRAGWSVVDAVTVVPRGNTRNEWLLLGVVRGRAATSLPQAFRGRTGSGAVRVPLGFPDAAAARSALRPLHTALGRQAGPRYTPDREFRS
ncbi:serine/threonine-protein kinase [Streptomyces sp. MS191]|uniref:serine/threonine-protein kinase n=1 Tax=Streptomyces sp. ms191 TaxID=1827978 RepID=UPI0021C6B181|nr:serine/threonine-protein kinase [Streptomyces sp. ms191]